MNKRLALLLLPAIVIAGVVIGLANMVDMAISIIRGEES